MPQITGCNSTKEVFTVEFPKWLRERPNHLIIGVNVLMRSMSTGLDSRAKVLFCTPPLVPDQWLRAWRGLRVGATLPGGMSLIWRSPPSLAARYRHANERGGPAVELWQANGKAPVM
ncbi:hypothetical protein AAFF_G00062600 [Aldrovandia affinis]|uniref:Uncharacterized protein n=1 Tax=Aldrovandia affinis TaxID=143900 RepID=A0AAD7RZH4_9TELE|nr:hypothetical protein AAFF_G00062600 [Aldrovandia affinis]